MDAVFAFFRLYHAGRFVGPPTRYENSEIEIKCFDANKLSIFLVRDFVIHDLKYAEVSVKNIYYKGLFDEMSELKTLETDDCIRKLISMVFDDGGFEVFVDHQVMFPEILLLEGGGVGADERFNADEECEFNGVATVDMGDLTQEGSAVNLNNVEGSSQAIRAGGINYDQTGLGKGNSSGNPVDKRRKYAETIKRYKNLDFSKFSVPGANDPPTRKGFPVKIGEPLPTVGDFEEDEEEGGDTDDDGEESDTPHVLRPIYDGDYEDGNADDWTDDWYNPDCREVAFKPGLKFTSHVQFKEAARKYAVQTGSKLKHLYNEKRRQRFICVNCPWKITATRDTKCNCFRVKVLCDVHICRRTLKQKLFSAKDVANHFRKKFHENPFYKCKDMMEDCLKELSVKVKWDKCVEAKRIIREELEGNFKEEYGLVLGYAEYLNSINPGNNIQVVTGRDTANGPLKFKKMYFCLGVLKEGWKRGCRPILGVDGCFLKTICGGVLLTAIGRDGNGGFYPVAWAVVQSESLDSWSWFFKLLQADLDLGNGENITIMSDQAPAILSARNMILPKAEGRLCARHIYCNLAKKHGTDDELRMKFWNCAKATDEVQWKKEMIQLYAHSEGAYNDIMRFDKSTWTKAFFQCHGKCDSPDNNISESFNAWIPMARGKAIISMNEDLMNKLIVRFKNKQLLLSKWNDISPFALKKLNQKSDLAAKCNVIDAGNGSYKVYDFQHRAVHGVEWSDQTCTCRAWQLTGIPCEHFIATTLDVDVDPVSFVSEYYRRDTWIKAYGKNIEITRGAEMWNDYAGDKPEPPEPNKKAGRPRRNRMKPKGGEVKRVKVNAVGVMKLRKVGKVIRCGICRNLGHNKRGCPQKDVGEASRSQTITTTNMSQNQGVAGSSSGKKRKANGDN